ncbi:O-antigen ligase family protein [Marinimicrobium locisalis]|uniref:O-antigen ligase family protein n=1 Tax=Marinimicrobium locisalis TaxID=546022 RepID=UPI003221DD7B
MTANDLERPLGRYQQKLPTLFLIWIALSAISPHPDLYKGWFHLAMSLPVLAMMVVGRVRIDTTDTLLRVCVGLLLYTTLGSLIVSQADWSQHLHALRWSFETLLLVLVLFLAVPPLLRDPHFLGRFLLTCIILGSLSALIIFGVFQGFAGRLSGIGALYQPIEGVSVLIIYLCIGAFLLWQKRNELTWKDQALLFSALILTCACTLLSGSRGPTLALALVVAYALLVGAIAHRHWKILLAATGCLVIALVGVLWLYGLENLIKVMVERGTSYRLLLWSAHLQHPPESLLFGHGAATDLESTAAGLKIYKESGIGTAQPHNLFIGTFAQTGLVGLGLLLLLLGTVLRGIYTARTSATAKWYMLGIFAAVMLLVTTNTYTLIISVKTIWLYTWLPLIFLWLWSRQTHHSRADTQ